MSEIISSQSFDRLMDANSTPQRFRTLGVFAARGKDEVKYENIKLGKKKKKIQSGRQIFSFENRDKTQ